MASIKLGTTTPGKYYLGANEVSKIYLGGTAVYDGGGIAPGDIEAVYDAILATSPATPIMFRLADYRGTQILFQDAACTIPVTTIGDPVGGVKDLAGASIVATQTTDSARPTWGGVNVGIVVSNSWLIVQAPKDYITQTEKFSLVATHRPSSSLNGRFAGIFSGSLATTAGAAGFCFEDRNSPANSARNFLTQSGSQINEVRTGNAYTFGQLETTALASSNIRFWSYVGGVAVGDAASIGSGGPFTSSLVVGRSGDLGPVTQYYGDIYGCLMYENRTLTATEVVDITALMEAT